MAKEKAREVEQAPNVNVFEMISARKVGKKVSYSKRKKIVMLETAMRLQAGKEYKVFEEKADYLIAKGVAKELK